jgi:hypothetical protein
LGISTRTQDATSQLADDALSVDLDGDNQLRLKNSQDNHSLAEADDESDDSRSVIASDTNFRDKLMGVFEVILSVESRLKSVEMKSNKELVGGQKPSPDKELAQKAETEQESESRDEDDICIPRIKVLDWYNFKHRWIDDKYFAIEVLKGPAKYYQDFAKVQQKYEKDKKMGNSPVRSMSDPDAEPDTLPTQEIPERIRIMSEPLVAIITELDPLGFTFDSSVTMLRPYRRLARMEDDLMEYLSGLEARWGTAEREDVERNVGPTTTGKISQVEANNPKDESLSPSESLTDSIEALRDLRCLKQFYEIYIHPTVNRLRDRTARKIRFADLWYLFPHGEEVFVPAAHKTESSPLFAQGIESATAYQSVYRVFDHSGGRATLSMPSEEERADYDQNPSFTNRSNPFRLMSYHIDWTAKSFSPVCHEIEIKAFDNDRDINSLEVYPTDYHQNFNIVREQLLERGRKFLKLIEPAHLNYYGQTYASHPCGPLPRYSYPRSDESLSATPFVDSEVMVDFDTGSQDRFYDWRPNFGLIECKYLRREMIEDWEVTAYQDKKHNQVYLTEPEFVCDDYYDERWLREHAREQDAFLKEWSLYEGSRRSEPIRSLSREEDLILLPSRVMGYSYRDRTFNAFNVDRLHPITQRSEGFAGLELPEGHQQLVEALVKEHFIKKEAYEKHGISTPGMDIVSGKGKGLIMLLHGYPGVGKTSTAECVAQSTGRPLFPITCGDLGLEPKEVEESLTAKFRLAAKWNCVMLIDEADIFLARRDKLDLQRNALVSGKSCL